MVAAVVVLYNPDENLIKNISSYIDCIEKVYVIDNSDSSNASLFREVVFKDKIEYVFNNGNLGIAKALNIGCELAVQQGMEWSLTMDQDSNFINLNDAIISQIYKTANSTIGLYYPSYIIEGEMYDKYIKENNEPIVVMTSGNILNLKVYEEVGGFEDQLFIDYVDIDYCLKLKKQGYKIANLPGANLNHELGQSEYKSFFYFNGIVTNHSSLRRYYITRNRLYVRKKYRYISSVFYKTEAKVFINDLLKIILFENDKVAKFKSIIQGYCDYRNNKFGIYSK
ncbi:glycosyltransferase family 2 protein [Flavobacterium sp. WC2416]|uniref:Glycosyltransferase family 2 protein n=1 Tax=Flavobacterium sp. WC2416 TaxID=3234141 RepID=A0AB39WD99_9FLAO